MGESAFSKWLRVSSDPSHGGKVQDKGGMKKSMKKLMSGMGKMKKSGMPSMKNNIFSTGEMNEMEFLNFIETDYDMVKMKERKKISPLGISSLAQNKGMNSMPAKAAMKTGMKTDMDSEMKEEMPKKMRKKMPKRMDNENMNPEPMKEEKMKDDKKGEDKVEEEAMSKDPENPEPEKMD